MIHHYLVRGYPRKELMNHFRRANALTQAEALEGKKGEINLTLALTKKRKAILATQYHPDNPDLRKIINKHWNIIEFSRDCGELFERPIVGFRRLPNLKDKLTNAQCTLSIAPEHPMKQAQQIEMCKKLLTCKYCRMLKKQDHTWNYNYTQKFDCRIPQKSRMTCKIKNVVYNIKCLNCQKQYTGEMYKEECMNTFYL